MKKMSGSGPLSWMKQAKIHEQYGEHGNWRFLPWHRFQLYHFERLIAKLSDNKAFALPYWNWQDEDALPELALSGPLSVAPSGLNLRRRVRPRETISEFMESENWPPYHYFERAELDAFLGGHRRYGTVESSGHNLVHVFVGGAMGQLDTATHDPLFWLHHCNVDRVWFEFSEENIPSYPPDWLNEKLAGFIDPLTSAPISHVARQAADTHALGYTYEREPVEMYHIGVPKWGGRAKALAPRNATYDLELKREHLSVMAGNIPAEILSDLAGSTAFIEISVDLSVEGDGYVLLSRVRPNSASRREWDVSQFSVPMGMRMNTRHAIQLGDYTSFKLEEAPEGLKVEIEAIPLDRTQELPLMGDGKLTFSFSNRYNNRE